MTREEQFRKTIEENRDRIFRICDYYFPGRTERDDAYQDSLIRIWQSLPSFRGESKVSTWIYRIVVNTCLASFRSEQKRTGNTRSLDRIDIEADPPGQAMEAACRDDNKMLFFRNFMQSLPGLDRTLVTLYLDELSTREMSEITGLSESNVRVRIHRIKEHVKKEWEETQHGIG